MRTRSRLGLFRPFLVTLAVLLLAAACSAESRAAGPHVSGFERFHTDSASEAAAGGVLLLGELNCTGCHRAEGGATVHVSAKQPPVLDRVATRVKPEYLRRFLRDPAGTKPGTTMPHVLTGGSEAERNEQAEALVHFLASLAPEGPEQAYGGIGDRARGEQHFHTLGCAACHGSRREGAENPPSAKPLGDLDAKYTLPALAEFLTDPLAVRPSGRMPSLNLTPQEARELAGYLLPGVPEKSGIAFAYYEGSWQSLPDFTKLEPKASGAVEKIDVSPRKRDNQFGLRFEGLLEISAEGEYTFFLGSDDGSRLTINGKVVVDHDGVHGHSEKSGKVKLEKGRHHTVVEYFEQSGEESLTVEFQGPGVKRQPIAGAMVSAEQPREIESIAFTVDPSRAARGRELFGTLGCASCHQLREGDSSEPLASRLAAPALASLKSEKGCLSETPGVAAPRYALTARQREALAAALAKLKQAPAKPAPREEIAATLLRLNCYACHERDGVGGVEEAVNALFTTTQPEMGDEGRIPPPLSGVGGKLTAEWFAAIMERGAKDRPYMLTRMPRFGTENAGHLQGLCEPLDLLEPVPAVAIDEREAKAAGLLMVGDRGFSCIKCHTFGRFEASGVQSIDMTVMTRRLREEWFKRYVDNPPEFRPGTRMPDAWPNASGRSLLPKILDGENATQIAAVWTYLTDGPRARIPSGLQVNSLELIPTHDAILYRNFIEGAGPRAIGVGYPEHFHLAFDANNMRIALLWQGAFIDASRHWQGRGQGFQGPAGQKLLRFPEQPSFARLEAEDSPWPTAPPRENGWKFGGYRLTEESRPTFLYEYEGVQIADFPNPVLSGQVGSLVRTLELSAANPPADLWFRAASAGTVEPLGDGWYLIDDQYRLRVVGGELRLREIGGRKELLAPVSFRGGKARLTQEFAW